MFRPMRRRGQEMPPEECGGASKRQLGRAGAFGDGISICRAFELCVP